MNIDKWIEDNKHNVNEYGDECFAVEVDKLRELLKTHAIVPLEPTEYKPDGNKYLKEADAMVEYDEDELKGIHFDKRI